MVNKVFIDPNDSVSHTESGLVVTQGTSRKSVKSSHQKFREAMNVCKSLTVKLSEMSTLKYKSRS